MKALLFSNKAKLVACILCIFTSYNSQAENYALIVNSENPINATTQEIHQEIRRLFLKEKKSWPGGFRAKPLSPKIGSSAYKEFITKFLNMDSAQLAQHWLRIKQTSGETPPREVRSTRIVTKLVGRTKGGFAVIDNADTQKLPATVRVLLNF